MKNYKDAYLPIYDTMTYNVYLYVYNTKEMT